MSLDPKSRTLLWTYVVYGVVFACFCIIIGWAIFLQNKEKEVLTDLAIGKEYNIRVLEASRGNILAYDGKLMATSVPVFDIYFDATVVPLDTFQAHIDSLSQQLARMFPSKTASQWKTNLGNAKAENKKYHPIAKHVTLEGYRKMQRFDIFNKGQNRGGIIAEKKSQREMPYNDLARRIIGYVNENENLYVGLEGAYNDYLKGRNGRELVRRLHHNNWIRVESDTAIDAKNGNDIVTTFDINLQDIVESALLNTMTTNKAVQGCAILMEVETGYIRACANLKLNEKTKQYEESYNFALAERYEPGSVFKIASMTVLFNQNTNIGLDDKVNIGNGAIKFSNRTMVDDHRFADNGIATVAQVIEQSSNKGTAVLITKNFMAHPEKYVDGLYALGLNKKPGTGIAGEAQPIIKHPTDKDRNGNKLWSNVSLPWMSIGYEVNVTPMQIITLYNAIANNGKMMKPQFVSEIRNGNQVVEHFEPVVINEQICPPKGVQMLQSMLEGVVTRGTAKRQLASSNVKMAGKTGTAQYCHPRLGYAYRDPATGRREYNTTFVGYFPADKPKYSCIIVVSRAHGQFWAAGGVSAPGFREIAEKVYAMRLGIEEDTQNDSISHDETAKPSLVFGKDANDYLSELSSDFTNYNTVGEEWVTIDKNADGTSKVMAAPLQENRVPDVVGMSLTDAVYLLESRGISTTFSGEGTVSEQSLPAGDTIKTGATMNLKLARK
ncbi:MAG: transpeptidase family protein [Bacteroidales bacterium]|nr:transpeptidase family protein [Bacteroidales bacterium]